MQKLKTFEDRLKVGYSSQILQISPNLFFDLICFYLLFFFSFIIILVKTIMGSTQPSAHRIPDNLWEEYFRTAGFQDLHYSALGVSTLPIPTFYRKNFKINSQKMSNLQFQYPSLQNSDLKEAFLAYFPPLKRFQDGCITKKNIAVTPGAVYCIATLIQSLVGPGDQIVVLDPIYPSHLSRIQQRNDFILKTCPISYDEKGNLFTVDLGLLKNTLSQKSKILLVCNPSNPTTNIWKQSDFIGLGKILANFPNLIVLQDCAYFMYCSKQLPHIPFGSISNQYFKKSISVYSGGKMFNTTGVRAGFVVAPQKIIQKLQNQQIRQVALSSCQDQSILCDNLKDAYHENYYEEECQKHEGQKKYIEKTLHGYGFKTVNWNGTYYLIIDVEQFRDKIDNKWYKRMDEPQVQQRSLDKAFSRMMFKEYRIGVLPLSGCYLSSPADRFVRLSFNRKKDDIEVMLNSFQKVANSFHKEYFVKP